MSCCCKNDDSMDELLQQERQLKFIDYYSHSILNEYINDGIISIIGEYVEYDFEVLTLNEQKQIRKEKRKERCDRCCDACMNRWNDCMEKIIPLWIIAIIIRIIINIVFIIISSIKIENHNCNGMPVDPVLYLFIGSIVAVAGFIFKIVLYCIAGVFEYTDLARVIGQKIIYFLYLYFILDLLFMLSWIIIGIIIKSNNKYECNLSMINSSIIAYIITECLLFLPSIMGHAVYAFLLGYYDYDWD